MARVAPSPASRQRSRPYPRDPWLAPRRHVRGGVAHRVGCRARWVASTMVAVAVWASATADATTTPPFRAAAQRPSSGSGEKSGRPERRGAAALMLLANGAGGGGVSVAQDACLVAEGGKETPFWVSLQTEALRVKDRWRDLLDNIGSRQFPLRERLFASDRQRTLGSKTISTSAMEDQEGGEGEPGVEHILAAPLHDEEIYRHSRTAMGGQDDSRMWQTAWARLKCLVCGTP
eukprot:Tamp_28682.p1 GENE.Tamp_28682~~Tamp_28682.p1  ORF type:complete len:242 (+),score=17.71 Tamp_28682:29-727(+)